MPNDKRHHRKPVSKQSRVALQAARRALISIARHEGTTVEAVRKYIQIAMIAGMASPDSAVQAEWRRLPCAGEVLTPEEVIAFYAEELTGG